MLGYNVKQTQRSVLLFLCYWQSVKHCGNYLIQRLFSYIALLPLFSVQVVGVSAVALTAPALLAKPDGNQHNASNNCCLSLKEKAKSANTSTLILTFLTSALAV